jgi:hypothetical protein
MMDTAVALVESYLRINGYFTVAEYPVIAATHDGGYRTVTDLDILGFRLPGAGRLVPEKANGAGRVRIIPPDPELGTISEHTDMIIGEVKEGHAELNRPLREASVLEAVLIRFGCCTSAEAVDTARELLRKGHAQTHCGHQVRLVAFGSLRAGGGPRHSVITLGHIVKFLRDYIRRYWDILHHADFKDPAFSLLVLLEKAEQGLTRTSFVKGGTND